MANISKVELNGTTYNINTSGSIPESEKGTANGVASLDSSGKVPSSQLPSYVDDVLEYSAKSSFPATGETGKIYVDTTTNKTYRWSGSVYVEISKSLALGETSSTAYRGDRGKAAYDHSQITNGNPHGTTGANTNLTGYSKGSSKDAVAATDTVNAAIAKHENRINANQSNILYGLEKIGTNLIKPRDDLPTVVTALPEGLRVQRSNTTSSFAYVKCGTVYLESGKKYALYDATYAPTTKHHYFYVDCGGNGFIELSTPSLTATVQYGTGRTTGTYDIYTRIDANSTVNTISTPIICLESVWKQFEAYTPYALPNYDLTRLEAEDRAGLVDVVDSGAKNILDFANLQFQTQAGTTHTKTDTDITVTSSSAWAACTYKMALSAGNYVFSAKISNLSIGSGGAAKICLDTQADGHGTRAATLAVEKNGTVSKPFTWGGGTLYIMYYPNYTATAVTTTFKASENMICTKAAFGVSNKFVPYCKSNSDLTGIIAKDTVTKQSWIKATDLNNVTTSGYYKFTGGPANSPCHTSGDYGMLIVTVFDNYITQLCHKYAFYPGLYTRSSADSGVTWSDWSDVPTTIHYNNDQSASMGSFPAGKVTFWSSGVIGNVSGNQWVSVQTDYFKADGTRKRQTLMGGSDGKTMFRYYNGTSWSAWTETPSGTNHYKADTTTTIGTDWTLTSIVLQAPVDALVPMTAMAFWGAKAPRGIRITRTNTSATNNVIATIEVSENKSQIQVSCFGAKLNGVNTYYVWAKANESGTMPIYLTYSYPIKD